ncbi:3-keto-5-aminohexanoate cleavage protein [Aliikangiella sp. IMCC44359]|uniref:3-keto-5-aminohexanoate cleavage protein n=1 Tax=Aliikangiella sp. IMCC44359 TaxID=3459125 RepID=UPI00403A949A
MGRKTILTCAVTGNITTREHHPKLPVTPKEIADASVEACKSGAAIVHIHARDVETTKGSMDVALYQEIVERIKSSDVDPIINLTTGEGGRFIPSDSQPQVAAPGSTLCHPLLRVSHIEKLKTELCTLDFNTMISGQAAVINTPANIAQMAKVIYRAGVKPELELFGTGDLHMALHFIEQGIIQLPAMFSFVLGVKYGAMATPETLFFLASQLPKNCIWSAFGLGRHEFPILAQAWLLGGHVRVGLEDNVYLSKGKLARDNAQLVEKGVTIVENLGGHIVSADEARKMLNLS